MSSGRSKAPEACSALGLPRAIRTYSDAASALMIKTRLPHAFESVMPWLLPRPDARVSHRAKLDDPWQYLNDITCNRQSRPTRIRVPAGLFRRVVGLGPKILCRYWDEAILFRSLGCVGNGTTVYALAPVHADEAI